MKTLIQTSVFAVLLFFFSGLVLPAAPTDGLKPVFTLDAADPSAGGTNKAHLPGIYQYPANAVAPESAGSRKTFFADALVFRLSGADPQAKYAVRGTFLSDAGRKLEFKSTDDVVDEFVLPDGKIVSKEWILPASSITQTQGTLVLRFSPLSGPNAVIQKLEVFSENPTKLALEANVPDAPFVLNPADLDAIAANMSAKNLTPRPAAVAGVATPVMSLNGTWQFSVSGNVDSGKDTKNIQVPGEWAMQGFEVPARAFAEYRRTFAVPADWSGKKAILRFDAVHAVCTVFVNGKEIGGHEGGFVPFELDATGAIKPGAQNEIRVRVQCESVADSVACMSQYAAHQVGGIVRKVTLFAVPETAISGQTWAVKFDEKFANATLEIATEIDGLNKADDVHIRHELRDAAGAVVFALSSDNWGPAIKKSPFPVSNLVKSPKHWTPETPNLYTLKTTLIAAGKETETLTQRIGFREVKIVGNRMIVNGNPVKLLGVCRHEVHPLRGRSLTPELCRQDAELYRAGNCNFIRTSHYPPSEEFLDACDELGLFVESEAAVCWIKHHASPVWRRWNHLDPKYFSYFLRANLDNIAANRNHPSVIMWSIANESLWTPLFAKVNEVVKKFDTTRPTAFHDQCWGSFNNGGSTADVANYHYAGESNPDSWSAGKRPVIFGEYVHLECYNRRELATDPFIREDWGRPTARMVDLMWEQPGNLGGSIWSGIDDVFHMPNGELRGYGHWGPIDGWRRKKPEYFGMQKAYAPVKFFDADKVQKNEDGTVKLRIQNRFNFTNLKDVKIAWKCGENTGVIRTDLEPHAKGEIKLPVGAGNKEDLTITVTDPRGFACATETIKLNEDAESATGDKAESARASREFFENENAVGFSMKPLKQQEPFIWSVDKKSGALSITRAGATIMNAPILPMILPLNGSGGASGPAGSVLTNKIEPFTPVCENWIQTKITGKKTGAGKAIFEISGSGDDADGVIKAEFSKAGKIAISYEFMMKRDINPRQWGLVFTLPRAFDTIGWKNRAGAGSTKANPVVRDVVEEIGKDLSGTDWQLDANALGTNLFRATKPAISRASLSNGETSFIVRSGGKAPAVRAWVDGDSVKLLVAGFNTGGADGFFGAHYAKERRPLKKGDKVSGSFEIGVD